MHVLIALQADRVRRHLRKRRVRALPDLGFARLHRDRAVEIQKHPVRGGFECDRPYRGVVPERRASDAAADRSGVLRKFPDLLVVADQLLALFKAFAVRIVIVAVLAEPVEVPLRHDVFVPVFHRIHMHRVRAFLDVRIVRKRRLRHAVAAHRARRGDVRIDRVRVAFHVVARIELRERPHRLCDDAVTVACVRALIGEEIDLSCRHAAVRTDPACDMEADRVAHAVRNKRLLARAVDAHRTTADHHGAPRAQRLIQRVLLVSEAAADIRLDDPDIRPGTSDRLSHHAADDVRDLRGAHDRDPPVFLIRKAAVVFDVAVLHRRRVVPALDPDKPGLFDRRGVIALTDRCVL